MSETAVVANIQRFSLDDGPGIRSVVFFKGCNLRCRWCHNPECLSAAPQLRVGPALCVGCGRCFPVCPNGALAPAGGKAAWSPEKCAHCGACAANCPGEALAMVGRPWSVEEIAEEAKKDAAYYRNSGGGVTLSGGEPLLRPDFCVALSRRLADLDIPVAIDTAGLVPWECFEKTLPWASPMLFDIKALASDLHTRLTGVGNGVILENFEKLCRRNTRLWIRIPLAARQNDTDAEIAGILGLLSGRANVEKVDILPLHEYGAGKYAKLGMPTPDGSFSPPGRERQEAIREMFTQAGFVVELH